MEGVDQDIDGLDAEKRHDDAAQAVEKEIAPEDQESSGNATALLSEPPKLAHVAQTLAAHGGGLLSVDLEFLSGRNRLESS